MSIRWHDHMLSASGPMLTTRYPCRSDARYADSDGNPLVAVDGSTSFPSVAACTLTGVGGDESMFVFFSLAWFDIGSWAWAHYIAEWGTKGVFAVWFFRRSFGCRAGLSYSLLVCYLEVRLSCADFTFHEKEETPPHPPPFLPPFML